MSLDVERFLRETHDRRWPVEGGEVLLPAQTAGKRAVMQLPGPDLGLWLLPAVLVNGKTCAFALLVSLRGEKLRYISRVSLRISGREWMFMPSDQATLLLWMSRPHSEHLTVLFGCDSLHVMEAWHSADTPVELLLTGSRGEVVCVLPPAIQRHVRDVYNAFLRAGGAESLTHYGTEWQLVDTGTSPEPQGGKPNHDEPL